MSGHNATEPTDAYFDDDASFADEATTVPFGLAPFVLHVIRGEGKARDEKPCDEGELEDTHPRAGDAEFDDEAPTRPRGGRTLRAL